MARGAAAVGRAVHARAGRQMMGMHAQRAVWISHVVPSPHRSCTQQAIGSGLKSTECVVVLGEECSDLERV